ncbi:MAG TPA: phage holin family protein [Actinocrinis sp.]|nr:phage holin family protein [Actinocrinis sp.]
MTQQRPVPPADQSVGALVSQASEQLSLLVRQEIKLARAEMTQKAKRVAIGGGMFGGAGLTALFAVQALVVAGIAGLALVLSVWAAALIVAGALLAVTGILALAGRSEVGRGLPPTPQAAIESTKADIETITERAHP